MCPDRLLFIRNRGIGRGYRAGGREITAPDGDIALHRSPSQIGAELPAPIHIQFERIGIGAEIRNVIRRQDPGDGGCLRAGRRLTDGGGQNLGVSGDLERVIAESVIDGEVPVDVVTEADIETPARQFDDRSLAGDI
jgi:hypothetical protein